MRFSKKFRQQLQGQTDKVVDEAVKTVGARFMNCLKPRPKYFPKRLWNWLIKKFVFDLDRFKMETADEKAKNNS